MSVSVGSECDPTRQAWRVKAVGRRPTDHIARDILHGAMIKDYRTTWYRDLLADPPDWMRRFISRRIHEHDYAQAIQNLALQMMHAHHLHRLQTESLVLDLPQQDVLTSLRRCPPYGVLVQQRKKSASRPWEPCRYSRVCPWCHARKAMKLYGQIARCLGNRRTSNRFLVLATVSETTQGLPLLQACRPDYMTFDHHIDIVHKQWHQHLLRFATAVGFSGGVLTNQISPYRDSSDADDPVFYRHHLAMLGEILLPDDERQRWFGDVVSGRADDPSHSLEQIPASIDWYILPANHRQALRFLLAGTSAMYPVRGLPLRTLSSLPLDSGIPGAFPLQPWFMFPPEEWWAYYWSTQGLRTYSLFGRWRQSAQPPLKQKRKKYLLPPNPKERARLVRDGALRRANWQRQQCADDRRKELLDAARPVWMELSASSARRPGRGSLQEALVVAGIQVSERDAKWLVERFRQENGA